MRTDRDGASTNGRRTLRRPWPIGLAIFVSVTALASVLGPLGVVVAAVTIGLWALAPIPYAIATGHVALIALGPARLDPVDFVVLEAGFAALIVGSLVDPSLDQTPSLTNRDAIAVVAVAAVCLVIAGAVTLFAATTLPMWAVAAVLLASLGTIAYGIHRYQLVRFGLIAELESVPDPAEYASGEVTDG